MPDSPYLPDHEQVADGANVRFDGSDGPTDAAIISGVYADFDATIHIDGSTDGGQTWEEIVQLTPEGEDNFFAAGFHTQFNRLMVSDGVRSLRIENVDTTTGLVGVDGDHR